MKTRWIITFLSILIASTAYAVPMAEDIATTIKLRGHDCGGREVSNINERKDSQGNTTIQATCPNGVRYQIQVSANGRVNVQPL